MRRRLVERGGRDAERAGRMGDLGSHVVVILALRCFTLGVTLGIMAFAREVPWAFGCARDLASDFIQESESRNKHDSIHYLGMRACS